MSTPIILISLFAFSIVCTLLVMPRIIGVVTYKRLMDDPNERSSHAVQTPSLGGIAFFIVFGLSILFLQYLDTDQVSVSILVSLIILFVIGLKDDLVVLSPITKIISEIFVVGIILSNAQFEFTQLHGFLGVEQIPIEVSLFLSGFVMIAIINAYNLIDGIDGLAGIIGIISFSVFGLLFYLLELYYYAGVALVGVGTLCGFLRFNLSHRQKIFMGDTGSLVIGFLISVLAVRLFSVEPILLKKLPFQLENLPILVLAILIVPFFDTARVFTIRLLKRKTPFAPDRNHIHHLMIDYLKLSHKKASIVLGVFNLLFILVFVFLCANFDNLITLGALVLMILALVYFFFRINFSYKNLRRRIRLRKRFSRTSVLF